MNRIGMVVNNKCWVCSEDFETIEFFLNLCPSSVPKFREDTILDISLNQVDLIAIKANEIIRYRQMQLVIS